MKQKTTIHYKCGKKYEYKGNYYTLSPNWDLDELHLFTGEGTKVVMHPKFTMQSVSHVECVNNDVYMLYKNPDMEFSVDVTTARVRTKLNQKPVHDVNLLCVGNAIRMAKINLATTTKALVWVSKYIKGEEVTYEG